MVHELNDSETPCTSIRGFMAAAAAISAIGMIGMPNLRFDKSTKRFYTPQSGTDKPRENPYELQKTAKTLKRERKGLKPKK